MDLGVSLLPLLLSRLLEPSLLTTLTSRGDLLNLRALFPMDEWQQ